MCGLVDGVAKYIRAPMSGTKQEIGKLTGETKQEMGQISGKGTQGGESILRTQVPAGYRIFKPDKKKDPEDPKDPKKPDPAESKGDKDAHNQYTSLGQQNP